MLASVTQTGQKTGEGTRKDRWVCEVVWGLQANGNIWNTGKRREVNKCHRGERQRNERHQESKVPRGGDSCQKMKVARENVLEVWEMQQATTHWIARWFGKTNF